MKIISKSTAVNFERVSGNKNQKDILYNLLKNRRHNISNISLPTKKEHNDFVDNNPYRFWYLIHIHTNCVGSAYIMKNNCIGISLLSNQLILPQVVDFIISNHKPLKEIKSLRPPYFYINIAPSNKVLASNLLNIGAKLIQSTYSLALTSIKQ